MRPLSATITWTTTIGFWRRLLLWTRTRGQIMERPPPKLSRGVKQQPNFDEYLTSPKIKSCWVILAGWQVCAPSTPAINCKKYCGGDARRPVRNELDYRIHSTSKVCIGSHGIMPVLYQKCVFSAAK